MKIQYIAIAILVCAAPLSAAGECFTSRQQRYTYEQGISSSQENEQITSCLKKNLSAESSLSLDKDLAALRKSGNIRPALPQVMNIFTTDKNPQTVFSAAAALISASLDLAPYEERLLNVLTSQAEDYKKTLTVVILSSMGAIGEGYSPFLNPALNAKDPVLQAYACSAYAILMPGTLDKYLNQIIMLYSFDKTLAKKAFDSTGLKNKTLNGKLKEDINNPDETIRLSAIEWIGDLGDKKLLNALLTVPAKYADAATLSAAANALSKNYDIASADLKKALKQAPSTSQATIAVMAYSFMGGESYPVIEPALNGNNNEKSNALRVISSIAGILSDDATYYKNPALEKQKIRKMIAPAGHIANNTVNEQVKTYADNTLKEIYKLINK